MKKILIILFCTATILYAGDFEDAEQLFMAGKFNECDKLIEQALKIKLPAQQLLKLQSMREYIYGNNPNKIAETVKKAKEIANHNAWLTDDLLNHSVLLIRRAEDWKSRGIPEYQELSNAAEKLLTQLKDGGNPEIAIKHILLQTRNFNLNGEYDKPIKLIYDVMRLYYPANRYSREKKSSGEIELLILLGEQYAGIATATRNEQSKTNALSTAAKYYLQVIEHIPEKSARYQDISNRLCLCGETLRLLGYNLRLPNKIKPLKSIDIVMIDEMLRTRRFHDVVIALENKQTPELRLRYAFALSAIGETAKAAAAIRTLPKIKEPDFLLLSARNALALKQKDDAAFFFQRFLEIIPDGPDAILVIQQYIAILMEQKKYSDGAVAFLHKAKLLNNQEQKTEAVFLAAQCFYNAEKYDECIKLFSEIPFTPERNILQAQAKIKKQDEKNALIILDKILKEKSLSEDFRFNTMKLAIFCALKTDAKETEFLLNDILQKFPRREEMPEYAQHLLLLYQKNGAPAINFVKLSEFFLKNAIEHPDNVAFVIKCAKNITEQSMQEDVLRGLLKCSDFSISELNFLIKQLPTLELKYEFLNRYKKPFKNTPELCELYFMLAEMEFALGNNKNSLIHLNLLLSQQEFFRYTDCMLLRIEVNSLLKQEDDVRKDCQSLLLTKLSLIEKRRIVLRLAQSWERSCNYKKAIASAWSAVPLNGKNSEIYVKELLELIIRNAKKIDSKIDIQDAQILLQ